MSPLPPPPLSANFKKFISTLALLGILIPSVNIFAAQEASDMDATTNKKAIGNRLTIADYNAIVDILAPLNVNGAGELTTEGLFTVPSFILNSSTTQTGIIENAVDVATDWASPSDATLATSAAIVAYVTDRVEAAVGAGTVVNQTLYWDNANLKWEPTSEIVSNPGMGVTVATGLTVTTGGAAITGDSSITGALTVSTTLGVTGITTLKDNLVIRNDADDADFVLLDNTSGSEAVTITGVLNTTGLASLDGGINANDNFTVDTQGNTSLNGTFDVTTSLASLDGGINVVDLFTVGTDGSTVIAGTGTLSVAGVTTVTGGLADGDTAGAVPLADGSNTTLPAGSTSILGALAALDGASTGMETLADGKIYVGDGTNTAIEVTPGGDLTMDNAGAFTLGNTAVTGQVLTGFTSGAGTIVATDTILEAFQKVNGNGTVNSTNIATNATNIQDINSLTEDFMYVGNALNVIEGVEVNSTVTGQVLTGFTSAAGTVAATDTILEAIEKIAGTVENLDTTLTVPEALGSQSTCDAVGVGNMEYFESGDVGTFWGCTKIGVATYRWVALSIFES